MLVSAYHHAIQAARGLFNRITACTQALLAATLKWLRMACSVASQTALPLSSTLLSQVSSGHHTGFSSLNILCRQKPKVADR